MEEVLQIQQNSLPPLHPDTAKTLNEIGTLYVYKGMMENATTSFQQCLEIATQLKEEELRMTAWENLNAITSQPGSVKEVTAPSSFHPRRSMKRQSSLFDPDVSLNPPQNQSRTLPRSAAAERSDTAKKGRSLSTNQTRGHKRESGEFNKSNSLDGGAVGAKLPPARPPLPAKINSAPDGVAVPSLKSLVPPARPPKPQHMRAAQKSDIEFLDPHDSSDASDLKRRLSDIEIRPCNIRKQRLIASS
jgi:hypothetical protein